MTLMESVRTPSGAGAEARQGQRGWQRERACTSKGAKTAAAKPKQKAPKAKAKSKCKAKAKSASKTKRKATAPTPSSSQDSEASMEAEVAPKGRGAKSKAKAGVSKKPAKGKATKGCGRPKKERPDLTPQQLETRARNSRKSTAYHVAKRKALNSGLTEEESKKLATEVTQLKSLCSACGASVFGLSLLAHVLSSHLRPTRRRSDSNLDLCVP